MTNSTPDPTTPVSPNPYASASTATVASARVGFDRWRWLLAGVIGILGGYLTISSINGGLINAISGMNGYPPELVAMFIAQAIFALVVTAFAYFVAPATLGRRLIAIALFVVIVIVLVVLVWGRLYGAIRVGGPALGLVLNTYWVVLLAGSLGWLIAAGARPVAYLGLLLTFLVMPLNFVFTLNNVPSGISTLVSLLVSLVVAVVILAISRPAVPAAVPDFIAMDEPTGPVATEV